MLIRKIKNVATDKIKYITIDKLIKDKNIPLGYEFTECGIWFDDYLLNEKQRKDIILWRLEKLKVIGLVNLDI